MKINKSAITFLFSQNISLFGSSVVGFVIIWYITLETSSGLWLMLATICSMLPQVIISLIAGVWADKYNRKHLIMLSDGFIAFATFLMAILLWLGYFKLELLLIISIIRSIGSGIQTPAVNAIYPQIVPKEQLVKIQGINQTLSAILLLLAPAVGGLLLINMSFAFLLDVVTALMAIIILSFLKVNKIEVNSQNTFFLNLKEGIIYTTQNKSLKLILMCYLVTFFLVAPIAILSPLLVERYFQSSVLYLTLNEIFWTIGSTIGGLYISFNKKITNKIKAITISLLCSGLTFNLLGLSNYFVFYLLILTIAGFFMPIIITLLTVLIQSKVPANLLGRVFSLVQLISASAMPMAILLFGPLADIISIKIIFIVSGILLIITSYLFKNSYLKILRNSV